MKKIFALCFAAALVAGATLALHAQGPGSHHKGGPGGMAHMEHMEEFLGKALSLNDVQKAAARKIHEETFAKAEPLMDQRHEQMKEIHALLDGDNPDATEIGQKMIASHTTGEKLKALHEEAMARFSALLNAEQLEKLKTFKEMHHDRHGFGEPEEGM
ncbi:MAG TPA: periplasmic heavy metal sensor [Thermoanaerobaculia bacterium]|nr:periplasmic heavy metal sensor [Thermoanaerobaculia bacterium]